MYLTIRPGNQRGWTPVEGEAVLVLVELPAAAGRQPRFLECAGQVVRADCGESAPLSFALALHTMRFLERAEAARRGGAPLPVQ